MLVPKRPKFELIEHPTDPEKWCVKITKGKFANTVFSYDKLTPTEKYLKYKFDIHETDYPNLSEENRELQKIVENILIILLQEEIYGEDPRDARSDS